MHRQRGFTLIELMIVVAVIAIVAAMAIPSLLSARKSGNEASSISSMRTLTTVNEQYRVRFGSYAISLAALGSAGYVDDVLAAGSKAGYVFFYVPGPHIWACQASPATPGTTGDRYFYVDHSGVIRFSTVGPATAVDPPID